MKPQSTSQGSNEGMGRLYSSYCYASLENNINCVYKEKYQFSETLITV